MFKKILTFELTTNEKNNFFRIYDVHGEKVKAKNLPHKTTNMPHRHDYYEICVFDEGSGKRGSRRENDLPLHRDGDYSIAKAIEHSIDWVGLYCIREGEAMTLIEDKGEVKEINLKKGQAIIFDNKLCRHGRRGRVGDRLLLRVWIEDETG